MDFSLQAAALPGQVLAICSETPRALCKGNCAFEVRSENMASLVLLWQCAFSSLSPRHPPAPPPPPFASHRMNSLPVLTVLKRGGGKWREIELVGSKRSAAFPSWPSGRLLPATLLRTGRVRACTRACRWTQSAAECFFLPCHIDRENLAGIKGCNRYAAISAGSLIKASLGWLMKDLVSGALPLRAHFSARGSFAAVDS